MAKRSTYDVSDAMVERFAKWTKTEAFTELGVYQQTHAIRNWMRNDGFAGRNPLIAMLRELHRQVSLCNGDRWVHWLVDRVTDCIERDYESHREVADAARTLLRSMTDEVDSIVKGGE